MIFGACKLQSEPFSNAHVQFGFELISFLHTLAPQAGIGDMQPTLQFLNVNSTSDKDPVVI